MTIFFSYAPAWVLAAYWIAVTLTVAYTLWKIASRKYLFSPYTIVIYTFAFALLVVAPFQYNDQAWQIISPALTAEGFAPYLDLSIGVNSMGFAMVIATLWFTESRKRERLAPPIVSKPPFIAITAVSSALIVGVVAFFGCLLVVGSIPLFGSRTVFNSHESLRPAYNFVNYLILFTTSVLVVWSFIAKSRKYALLVIVGLVCMLFTGGRTSFLSVAQLAILMWVYQRYQNRKGNGTWLILGSLSLLAVAGLFLASFRAGGEFQISGIIDDFLYGNTFSDVRDGAYVASGWDQRMASESLGGNTYLAGLMSFIPSSLSTFRETWSWGYFTTSNLFGWDNHYGFRGGWSLEMYMNFGPVGVIVAAIACGWLLGRLEAMFFSGVIREQGNWYPNAYLWSWLGYGMFTVLIASSATYNLYSLLGIVVLLRLLTLLRESMHNALGIHRRPNRDRTFV
ncbi:O-antigen polymerase [Arthrobacter psychrochitiniphilus]|uniref:O-antigen polymerase n=1 Tax=Arthrobacter psychrochitiniphilus TaxID=291045 RepID=UPI003F7C0006